MRVAIVILCLFEAIFANPLLHSVAMEPTKEESDSSQSSSVSESSEQSDTSENDSSQENTSENTSESLESNSFDETSASNQSQSIEDEMVQSVEDGITTDNSLGSEENIRKGWIRLFTIKLMSEEDNSTEATSLPEQEASEAVGDTSSVEASLSSESSESSESQDDSNSDGSLNNQVFSNSIDPKLSKPQENGQSVSSSSSSSESSETGISSKSDKRVSPDCRSRPSQDCGIKENSPQTIGDDEATHHLFNGYLMPDEGERELQLRK